MGSTSVRRGVGRLEASRGADRVYFFTRDSVCVVMKTGKEMETLAENKFPVKGKVYGVAAIEGSFVVRTGTAFVRIGK